MDEARVRRAPPPFRRARVRGSERVTPYLVQVTLVSEELRGLDVTEPAASVRLLLPSPGQTLVIPEWTGNEFLLPDGRRPVIRTLTPVRTDPDAGELDLAIVLHGGGAAGSWAEAASPGDDAAVSGPARGYVVDEAARSFLLAGDETAIPALRQVLAALPEQAAVEVHVEVAHSEARLDLGAGNHTKVHWHVREDGARPGDALVHAVTSADLTPDVRVFAAGEAAAVQRIRQHLFETEGIPRAHATIRGYWKFGRSASDGDGPRAPGRS